jgi:protein arginine kinase
MADLKYDTSWFSDQGPEQDVVMSSRVRLARNVVGYAFPGFMRPRERAELEAAVAEYFADRDEEFQSFDTGEDRFRDLLVERNFFPAEPELEAGPLYLRNDERLAVQVNNTDHLRIVSYRGGLDLRAALEEADEIDDSLEDEFPVSVSLEWGYLTARLDDLGTGLRASTMLHLPGLRRMGLLDEALGSVWKEGFSVRGFALEGTESLGDVYQIASRQTLGIAEEELVEKLERATMQLVDYERRVRESLSDSRRGETEDAVYRALGILAYSRCLTRTEAFRLLSWLRLGVALGMAQEITLAQATSLFFLTQRSHVVHSLKGYGIDDSQENEDEQRAVLLRRYLESQR